MSKKEEFLSSASALPYQELPKKELPEKKESVPSRPKIQDLVFESRNLLDENGKYNFDLTENDALQDMADLFYDILSEKYHDIVHNLDVRLHYQSSKKIYVLSFAVFKELANHKNLSKEDRSIARYHAENTIDEIMDHFDESNSGEDENDPALKGFDINHRRREIVIPTKKGMLDMLRNYAAFNGMSIYSVHGVNYNTPVDVEKTRELSFKLMMAEKAEDLASCHGEEGFSESVSDCTLMKIFMDKADYLAHAQLILESVKAEEMEFSARFAIIESKIFLEDREKMGNYYDSHSFGAVRPSLN